MSGNHPLLSPEREREIGERIMGNRDTFLCLALEVLSRYKDPRGEFEEARVLARAVLEDGRSPVGIERTLEEVRRAVIEVTGRIRPRPARKVRLMLGRMDACLDEMRRAVNEMVLQNQGLVFHVARRLPNRGLPLEDLVQEGQIGLMKAALRFDPGRGCRFSTFATWWILQSMNRAMEGMASIIRLPASVHEKRSRIFRAFKQAGDALEGKPTLEGVAARTGMTEREVRAMLRAPVKMVSLDHPASEDGDFHPGHLVVVGYGDEDSFALAAARELRATVEGILARLDERERFILTRRFGLDGGMPASLSDLGEIMGLSRERVRQIQKEAMEKLRAMDRRSGGRLRALCQ